MQLILLGSGDMKVMQFQIETGQKVVDLEGHNGDVAALSLKPDDRNVFATGSVDRTARIWDLRAPGNILSKLLIIEKWRIERQTCWLVTLIWCYCVNSAW